MTNGWTDREKQNGWMDGRADVQIPPVFYRSSSPLVPSGPASERAEPASGRPGPASDGLGLASEGPWLALGRGWGTDIWKDRQIDEDLADYKSFKKIYSKMTQFDAATLQTEGILH